MTDYRRRMVGVLAVLAIVAGLISVYLLGYQHGSHDALDWQFSAVVGGRIVSVGHGSSLLRSKAVPLKPTQSVNVIAQPFAMKRP